MKNLSEFNYNPVPFRIRFSCYNPFEQLYEGNYSFLSDALMQLRQNGRDITKVVAAEFLQHDQWNSIDSTVLQGEIHHALQQGGQL